MRISPGVVTERPTSLMPSSGSSKTTCDVILEPGEEDLRGRLGALGSLKSIGWEIARDGILLFLIFSDGSTIIR